jgi:hypothetical protein
MRYLVLISLVLLAAAPATAQHGFGAREQWHPQLAPADPRLRGTVEIEITGRPAAPVTEMLSEATGVSLGLAPEDLATLGERKLTIISKGLTLQTIMVQIPEALQECHWDIDPSGDEPIYLLHRNAGAGHTFERQMADDLERVSEMVLDLRAACLDDARRALAMSPEELAELEQTDLFLARAARHPDFRAMMQSIFALPEDHMAELVDTGDTHLAYADAPPEIQRAARLVLDQRRRWLEWLRSWPPEAKRPSEYRWIDWDAQIAELEAQLESGEGLTIGYTAGLGREEGSGVMMHVGEATGVVEIIVPARHHESFASGNYYHFLLTQTGDDDEAAIATIERLSKEWLALPQEQERSESDWVEPSDPRLQQVVPIPFTPSGSVEHTVYTDLPQLIAERTGLSIISDYFTRSWIRVVPEQRPLSGPLWRDLYVLAQAGRFEWKLVGDCLVFHREDWSHFAQCELPESFIERWRTTLEGKERFTLDDIVQVAAELEDRPEPPFPPGFIVPSDLLEAGADVAVSRAHRGMLLLYHALTPEERAAARTPDGLPLSQLPPRKQREIADYVLPVPRSTLWTPVAEFVAGVVFFLDAGSGEEAGAPPTQYEFTLTYPPDLMLSMGDWSFAVQVAPDPSAGDHE